MRVRAFAVVVVGCSMLACLDAQERTPKGADAAKDKSAHSAQPAETAKAPIQAPTPPVTVVVQAPAGDPEAKAKEEQRREEDSAALWWTVRLNGGLLVVGLITGAFVAWQSYETRQSAQAAALSVRLARESLLLTHRPKLEVRNVVIPAMELLHMKSSLQQLGEAWSGGPIVAYYHVVNVGQTRATIKAVDSAVLIADRLPMKRPYDDGVPSRSVNIELAPGAAVSLDMSPLEIPDSKLIEILHKTTNVFVFALIDYVDDLGQSRQTAICRQLNHESRRFVLVDDLDYEYAD